MDEENTASSHDTLVWRLNLFYKKRNEHPSENVHNFTFSLFTKFGENLGLVSFITARADIQTHKNNNYKHNLHETQVRKHTHSQNSVLKKKLFKIYHYFGL